MHDPRATPSTLLLVASISIAALMALSDFGPERVTGFEDLSEDPMTMSAIVLRSRLCTGGLLLDLSDGVGGEATAFCPADLLGSPPPDGTALEITVQRASGDPDFLYIRNISMGPDTGKD